MIGRSMSKGCPACRFEERHLRSCHIRILILAGQKLREELAEVGDNTDMIWDGELLREWDAAVAKSDVALMKTVDDE